MYSLRWQEGLGASLWVGSVEWFSGNLTDCWGDPILLIEKIRLTTCDVYCILQPCKSWETSPIEVVQGF